MAKSSAIPMASLAAIACYALVMTTTAMTGGNGVHAFQVSNVAVASTSLSSSIAHPSSFATTRGGGCGILASSNHSHSPRQRRRFRKSITSIRMMTRFSDIYMDGTSTSPSSNIARPSSLFPSSTSTLRPKSRQILQRIRRKFTALLASLAVFLSLLSPAHASSSAASTSYASTKALTTTSSSSSSSSLVQRLNPFRTQSADEMIEAYVKSKLFEDDVYDAVESAYREAISDQQSTISGKSSSIIGKTKVMGSGVIEGASYPTLLAETANAALGQPPQQQQRQQQLLPSKHNKDSAMKNDGLTSLLIQASDLLQSKLGVSASTSYTIVAAAGIVGVCVVPTGLGVLYQGIQRIQIDWSERKTYGKVVDVDATSKRVTDDDDDEDDEDE